MSQTVGKAVCPYCGVGCVVGAEVQENRILRLFAPKTDAPNFGMLCPKGAYLKKVFVPERRLAWPMIRRRRGEPPEPVSWTEAIGTIAERLHRIRREHGSEGIAFYGSGQLDTEAAYLFTKFMKGAVRSNHMDTNSRLCMSSAVAAYVKAFGADGPPPCYEDIEHAEVFLIIGANMASNHPVLFQRIRKRRLRAPNVRIIVVDPRRTETARFADVHIPVAPGGDAALLLLISKRLAAAGRVDLRFVQRHTEGYSGYLNYLESLDEKELLRACEVNPARVEEAVELLLEPARLLSFYCQGINQSTSGVEKNLALINLHLMLGEIGKPGAGPFSLTGQPNAMGGREVGYLSHQLPGYRYVWDPSHREEMEALWGIPRGSIAPQPGLSAVPMFRALAEGRIRALWVAATNPAVSFPDANAAQEALRRAELVIVQDCYYPTETAEFADVLLPAAQWGEKTGTMTDSERRVVRSQQFLQPPGEAKPDWWIVAQVARAMGFSGFEHRSAEEVWDEFRTITRGRPCDMSGMTNERLAVESLQWPCPHPRHRGTARLYTRGRFPTPTGRARFHLVHVRLPAEVPDPEYPLTLTTGRIPAQWHTRTRTGNVPELNAQAPYPFVQVHPETAQLFGMREREWVYLVSRRGRTLVRVEITDAVPPGVLFSPFHWGETFHPETNLNRLTHTALDPISEQPELKHCAVRVEPIST
ncbi:MAG: nitrate reductase catalytic subunit [Candidatus Poribacteria bacterium]|nr:MAG: nitrate reductase catalytic subunit [Candidatus Poribacteria bacterium]